MPILNTIRPVSLGGFLKNLLIDKTITRTMGYLSDKDKLANRIAVLTTQPQNDGSEKGDHYAQSDADLKTDLKHDRPRIDTDHPWAGAFIETYGFHGLDLPSGEFTYSYDRRVKKAGRPVDVKIEGSKLPPLLAFVIFLGLPSRVLNVTAEGQLRFDAKQFWHNLIGGWDRREGTKKDMKFAAKKNWWNRALIPVKAVIFAYYLATFPLKLAFNIVKFFGLMLPLVIKTYAGVLTGYLFHKSSKNFAAAGVLNKFAGFIIGVLSLPVFAFHTAVRVISLVSRALFTPETSARLGWGEGRAVKNSFFSILFGTIGGLLSVALTTALLIILLPLAINTAVIMFPSLLPLMTALAAQPVIAASLVAIKGGFALAIGSLPAAFTSAATWLASLVGLTLTSQAVAVGATLAAIATTPLIIGSRIADELSNSWARWQRGGIINWVVSGLFVTARGITSLFSAPKGDYKPLPASPIKGADTGHSSPSGSEEETPPASPEVERTLGSSQQSEKEAREAEEQARALAGKAGEERNAAPTRPTAAPKEEEIPDFTAGNK